MDGRGGGAGRCQARDCSPFNFFLRAQLCIHERVMSSFYYLLSLPSSCKEMFALHLGQVPTNCRFGTMRKSGRDGRRVLGKRSVIEMHNHE